MKKLSIYLLLIPVFISCNSHAPATSDSNRPAVDILMADSLADMVRNEARRSWNAYKEFAWGHDALKPLSRAYADWYEKPLYISPIDAYGTLKIMGFDEEASEIENYVVDSLDFNVDQYVKVFEVNIRILGGLLSMYELSGKNEILDKARDFADRLLPAFQSKTGIPSYWVNLKTGETKGDTVNVAEAGTYLIEMGVLSRHTGDPVYFDAAKKASMAVFERRSELDLIGSVIDIQSGEWVSTVSHICAGVDSYYEYLLKGAILFKDKDLKNAWDQSILAIQKYLRDSYDNNLWYGRADMYTGNLVSSRITLYDAFFPAVLILSGDREDAGELQQSWDWLWHKYGLEPMVYDYKSGEPTYPVYDLNPEIIESAYYLYHYTSDVKYFNMLRGYWESINKYCRTDVAYTSIKDVRTMEQKDYMPTFFFAETLKYFYLAFTDHTGAFNFENHIFSTEAHPFKIHLK